MSSALVALFLPNLWPVQAHRVVSINLAKLYPKKHVTINENQCNFLQMDDKTVVFFHPDERKKFSELMSGKSEVCVSTVLELAPSQRRVSQETVTVRWQDGRLYFGTHVAMKSEVRRSRINPKWHDLAAHYDRGRLGDGKVGASVIELPDDMFLVTGGVLNDSAGTSKNSQLTRSAQIFDGKSNKVIKTFKLATPRTGHRSLPLSNGKILLIGGGNAGSPIAEIVDTVSGTSVPLKAKEEFKRLLYTACLDDKDNCFLLCGTTTDTNFLKTVDVLGVREVRLERIDRLRLNHARMFFHHFDINYEPDNAHFIADNLLLVSGGMIEDPMFSERQISVKNADLIEFTLR